MKTPSAHARLRLLQHRIYRALEREARAVFGKTPASIRRYQSACERDLRGRYRTATKSELIQAIRGTPVTFVADYHTFAQAQRTALRLLREAVLPGENWALGLELIPSQYQRTLDEFQQGKLSVPHFHERICYQEQWGFPWKNYEPLFDWARKHEVRLIALNRPKELVYQNFSTRPDGSGKDLHARDQWAAGIITDLFAQEPALRMVVLYGGLHVGRQHLPRQLLRVSRAFLKKPLRSLSVHQNHGALYWKLARQQRELHTQILKLKQDVFCVFSGTPWAQLQSLIGSAEGEDLEAPDGAPGESSSEVDYLSLMRSYGDVIAEFLGLAPVSFESLSVRTIEEADFVEELGKTFTPRELGLIRQQIHDNHRVYLPRAQIAYLASPSQNAAAELAAIHLHRKHTRLPSLWDGGREDFFRQVLEAGFGFLGSLILNPRRKCDLPADQKRRIRGLSQGEKPLFTAELQARRLALDVMTGTPRKRDRALSSLSARPGKQAASSAAAAARFVGQALAKRLYPVILAEKHDGQHFQKIIALFLRRRGFEEAYSEFALKAGQIPHRADPSKLDSL